MKCNKFIATTPVLIISVLKSSKSSFCIDQRDLSILAIFNKLKIGVDLCKVMRVLSFINWIFKFLSACKCTCMDIMTKSQIAK